METKIVGTSFTNITQEVKHVLQQTGSWYDDRRQFDVAIRYKVTPEPSNPMDSNALRVDAWFPNKKQWVKVGYVPKNSIAEFKKQHPNAFTTIGTVTIYPYLDNFKFTI